MFTVSFFLAEFFKTKVWNSYRNLYFLSNSCFYTSLQNLQLQTITTLSFRHYRISVFPPIHSRVTLSDFGFVQKYMVHMQHSVFGCPTTLKLLPQTRSIVSFFLSFFHLFFVVFFYLLLQKVLFSIFKYCLLSVLLFQSLSILNSST